MLRRAVARRKFDHVILWPADSLWPADIVSSESPVFLSKNRRHVCGPHRDAAALSRDTKFWSWPSLWPADMFRPRVSACGVESLKLSPTASRYREMSSTPRGVASGPNITKMNRNGIGFSNAVGLGG
jgi:hypothetical protein